MGITEKGRARLEAVAAYVAEHNVSENEAARALGIPDASWYNLKRSAAGNPVTKTILRKREPRVETVAVAPLPNTPPYLQSRVVAFVGEPKALAEMFRL